MSPIAILSHLILKRFNIFLFSRSPISYIRSILTFSDETALEINVRRNTMCHQGYPVKILTFLCHNFIVHLSRAQIVQYWPFFRIEATFQVSRPACPPQTRPCARSKRLKRAMIRTLNSFDSVASAQLQWAQFSIAIILPGSTHAAGSRWYFRSVDLLFHHEHGLACGQRGWGARWIARWLHPTVC